MSTSTDFHAGVKAFAAMISRRPLLGLASHRPELWAQPRRCFENAMEKVRRDGGNILFGWTFNLHDASDIGEYITATHHAVWHAPGGHLIDVTPFLDDRRLNPYTEKGGVLFLVDNAAKPVVTDKLMAPLPLRYFPLSDDERLRDYLNELSREEELECRKIYEGRAE